VAPRGKPTRTYESPRRREQAAATRREILAAARTRAAILDAAEARFRRDGYAATSVAAVAKDAGVALKTVYLAFDTKAGLLRALWNARLRAGADVPISEHPWYQEVLAERDPVRRLRGNARNSRAGKERIGALTEVIRAAAPADPDVAALWDRINTEYRANQRAVVEGLPLRPGLDAERAADVLWTINHPGTWHLLVGLRGWTPEEYERWSAAAAVEQLLAQDAVQQ